MAVRKDADKVAGKVETAARKMAAQTVLEMADKTAVR
jgi:hypothetical protein